MKRAVPLLLLLLLSCTPSTVKLGDLSEKDGETYFTIKASKAEFQGVFGTAVNPLMWKVAKEDIVKVEQILEQAARSKRTHHFDRDTNKLVDTTLTDQECSLMLDVMSRPDYRVYTAGTNARHNKIMEVLFYPAADSSTITADILVDSSDGSVELR